MRAFLAFALIFSISTLGLVGCAEKAEEKTVTEKTTPTGTVKETEKTTVEKTGDEKTKP